jgi:hypothetical protein
MTHALGTFTYNQQAVGLYTSFGMLPHEFLTLMEGNPSALRVPSRLSIDVSSEVDAGDLPWINRLEAKIRGYARPEEWRFWSRSDEHRVFLLRRRGRRIGYGMFGPRGEIQPVGVVSPPDLVGAVDALVRRAAADGRENVRFFCPNRNRELYRHLHLLGLRNREMSVFMTDKPYGDFARYVPAALAVF